MGPKSGKRAAANVNDAGRRKRRATDLEQEERRADPIQGMQERLNRLEEVSFGAQLHRLLDENARLQDEINDLRDGIVPDSVTDLYSRLMQTAGENEPEELVVHSLQALLNKRRPIRSAVRRLSNQEDEDGDEEEEDNVENGEGEEDVEGEDDDDDAEEEGAFDDGDRTAARKALSNKASDHNSAVQRAKARGLRSAGAIKQTVRKRANQGATSTARAVTSRRPSNPSGAGPAVKKVKRVKSPESDEGRESEERLAVALICQHLPLPTDIAHRAGCMLAHILDVPLADIQRKITDDDCSEYDEAEDKADDWDARICKISAPV